MIEHLSSKLCDDDFVNAPKVLRTCVYVQKPIWWTDTDEYKSTSGGMF